MSQEKRWVYGTRTDEWYLVDKNDRDWIYGISEKEFKKISRDQAKKKYLRESIIK